MAARGVDKEGAFCARCFAHVAKGEAYCPECGAPTGETAPAAESAVHGELAQANLLRLRGDLDGSEKTLLTVLRRYPNDPYAHEMLGDLCVERGENERAIEWYELALDIAPNSPDVRRKLDEASDQLVERETADTAETLGLPESRPTASWMPLAGTATLVVLAIAVAAWPRGASPSPLRATVVAPVESAPADPAPAPPSEIAPPPTSKEGETDRELLDAVQKGAGSVRVQSVALDPRTQTLDIAFETGDADDPRATALTIGKEALAAAPTAMTATLRAVRGGQLVFSADLPRSGLTNPEPLTNVWPTPEPGTPPATPPEASPTTPPATTTSTTATAGSTGATPPSSPGTTNGGSATGP